MALRHADFVNLDKGSDTGDISSKDKKPTRERERDTQTDELVGEAKAPIAVTLRL